MVLAPFHSCGQPKVLPNIGNKADLGVILFALATSIVILITARRPQAILRPRVISEMSPSKCDGQSEIQ